MAGIDGAAATRPPSSAVRNNGRCGSGCLTLRWRRSL